MKKPARLTAFLAAPLLLAALAVGAPAGYAQQAPNAATAEIRDAQGAKIGDATLTTMQSGKVLVRVQVNGFGAAAAGEHGVHIHAVGSCAAPGFTTAGGHFNPASKKHGLNSPDGHHAGDMPNLLVSAGSATYRAEVEGISLQAGTPDSIFDADGSAIVIHAGPDDLMTDPAGNSGARVACGVLAAATLPTGMPSTGGGRTDFTLWLAAGLGAAVAGLLAAKAGRATSS